MYASLLLPGQRDLITELPVSIVGYPTVVNRRVLSFNLAKTVSRLAVSLNKRRGQSMRYARQGFLGPNSDNIIRQTVVGIVGLGGGGSPRYPTGETGPDEKSSLRRILEFSLSTGHGAIPNGG